MTETLLPGQIGFLPGPWITPFSRCALGVANRIMSASSDASTAWGVANQAIYVPFQVDMPFTVARFGWLNGTVSAGNIDCGLFTSAGVKLLSTGSTAQGTVSVIQVVDVTDTTYGAGRYFIGLSASDATATFFANPLTSALRGQWVGCASETSALPLPSTFTPANYAPAFLPWFGLSQRDAA